MKRRIWALGAFVVAVAAGPAAAAERFGAFGVLDTIEDVIVLDGDVDSRSVKDFRRALRARPSARVLVLDSNGGNVQAALMLAAEIRRHRLGTAIPSVAGCYSACAYLFFAGQERVVRGKLGVHQAHTARGNDPAAAAAYFAAVRAELARYDIPEGVFEKMTGTGPADMHVFTPSEIAALGINRASDSSRTAQIAARW